MPAVVATGADGSVSISVPTDLWSRPPSSSACGTDVLESLPIDVRVPTDVANAAPRIEPDHASGARGGGSLETPLLLRNHKFTSRTAWYWWLSSVVFRWT